MSVRKAIMFLGAMGFLVCLVLLLAKTYEASRLPDEAMNLETEATALREALEPVSNLVIVADRTEIAMRFPGDIFLFSSGDSSLTPEAQRALRLTAQALAERYDRYKVCVIGHTDNRGDSDSNQQLGRRRAETVAEYLVANGLERSQVQAMSMGEDAPISSNQTNQGRALNRRVEVQVVPIRGTGLVGQDLQTWSLRFIAELQTNPLIVALGLLSSLITVISWLAGLFGRRRYRGIAY